MDKEFIPYEQALVLKELGFDEPCFGYFNTTSYLGISSFVFKECDKSTIDGYGNKPLLRPTFSQAFRWFREKYNQHHFIHYHSKPAYTFAVLNDIGMYWTLHEKISFKTYEEAELACLCKLIEIVKNKTAAD